MADEDELVASARSVEEVRELIGATSLAYLSLDGLQDATRRPEGTFCRACLTRSYPTQIPEDLKLAKLRFEGQTRAAGKRKPREPDEASEAGDHGTQPDRPVTRAPRQRPRPTAGPAR